MAILSIALENKGLNQLFSICIILVTSSRDISVSVVMVTSLVHFLMVTNEGYTQHITVDLNKGP